MLGKLLKHEFQATGRLLLPLYGILFLAALLSGIINRFHNANTIMNIATALSNTAYIFSIVLIGAAVFVLMIYRFYKNLLGDEGYLMFTLPVNIHQLILSKLITSLFWIITVVCFVLASLYFVFIPHVPMSQIIHVFQTALDGELQLIELLPFLLASLLSNILMIFASIAIGQLFSKSKLLSSFIAYICLYGIMQVVLLVFIGIILAASTSFFTTSNSPEDFIPLMQFKILSRVFLPLILLGGGSLYLVTSQILKKRLNLE